MNDIAVFADILLPAFVAAGLLQQSIDTGQQVFGLSRDVAIKIGWHLNKINRTVMNHTIGVTARRSMTLNLHFDSRKT